MSEIYVVYLGIIVVEALLIAALGRAVYQLMKRPDFKVVQALQKDAVKARKDLEAVRKAFDAFRASNGRDVLIINIKDVLDADAVAIMLARIVEQGSGVVGSAANVEILLTAAYGLEQNEEFPQHIKHIIFGNGTRLAVYTGKLNNELKRIIDED